MNCGVLAKAFLRKRKEVLRVSAPSRASSKAMASSRINTPAHKVLLGYPLSNCRVPAAHFGNHGVCSFSGYPEISSRKSPGVHNLAIRR
jgi:hypothetical protein